MEAEQHAPIIQAQVELCINSLNMRLRVTIYNILTLHDIMEASEDCSGIIKFTVFVKGEQSIAPNTPNLRLLKPVAACTHTLAATPGYLPFTEV